MPALADSVAPVEAQRAGQHGDRHRAAQRHALQVRLGQVAPGARAREGDRVAPILIVRDSEPVGRRVDRDGLLALAHSLKVRGQYAVVLQRCREAELQYQTVKRDYADLKQVRLIVFQSKPSSPFRAVKCISVDTYSVQDL